MGGGEGAVVELLEDFFDVAGVVDAAVGRFWGRWDDFVVSVSRDVPTVVDVRGAAVVVHLFVGLLDHHLRRGRSRRGKELLLRRQVPKRRLREERRRGGEVPRLRLRHPGRHLELLRGERGGHHGAVGEDRLRSERRVDGPLRQREG